jgi:hypothetical protein
MPRQGRSRSAVAYLVATLMALAGCAGGGDSAQESVREEVVRSQTSTSSTAPSTTVSPSTTTTSAVVDAAFVRDCVDHVLFLAYVGDVEAASAWQAMGQDETLLELDCERVASDASSRREMQSDMDQLESFFAAQAAPATTTPTTTTTQPTTTSTLPRTPPKLRIDCPSTAEGDWEWYHVDFGYLFEGYAPIVEWGMDYGDGKSFTTDTEASAEEDLFWHRYQAPGSYRATAWVIDANGKRVEDSCTFNWQRPAPVVHAQPAVPRSGGCDPNYSGCVPIASDVDCAGGSGNGPAYTGTVQVIGVDIYGLDRDGDGWACE